MKRRTVILLAIALAVVAAGTWQWQRLASRQATIQHYLPTPPSTTVRNAEFASRIATATRDARHGSTAPSALVELSRLYHANGFSSEALACYEALRRIEPDNARWPHLEAMLLNALGRSEETLALEQHAVALAPDYLPARLRLGDLLLKANRPADSDTVYAEVLRRSPGNPYALLGLARGDMIRDDWSQARERLRTAVAQHPDFIGGLSLLVSVSERLGDAATAQTLRETIGRRAHSDAADPWFDELWSECYDAYRLSVAAAIARAAGDLARAQEILDRAIALAPDSSLHRRNLAELLLTQNNPAAARPQLERAVALEPTDADSWILLVDTLRKLGQPTVALQALNQGLAHCPQSGGLHLEKARELLAARRFPEAIAAFRQAAALRPTEATPLVELADALLATGQAEEGVAALHQALNRQPGNALALTSLVFYHIVTGDETAARRYWQEVRQQPRAPAAMLDRLRTAYQRQFNHTLP